jgi:hypothetical protein
MNHSTLPDCEPNPTSTLPEQPGVLVVRKHHFLVRCSHWLNVPILLGLILSGISIYYDLTYVPVADRGTSLKAIDAGMKRIEEAITKKMRGAQLNASQPKGEKCTTKLLKRLGREIKPCGTGCEGDLRSAGVPTRPRMKQPQLSGSPRKLA